MNDKDERQAEYFRNRLIKSERLLKRWRAKDRVYAYRIYDRDIPEIPLAVDVFRSGLRHPEQGDALLIALYERPYEKDPALEEAWLERMALAASDALGIEQESIFTRTRKRQKGNAQYERLGSSKAERLVEEAGLLFSVNLSDYLDTGLFLDHRPMRAMVRAEARGKRVLNLFCYTGSFSVYAAAGGATELDSVDLSRTYLDWAERNFRLNDFSASSYRFHKADVRQFLRSAKAEGRTWDVIIADPPTFSNSKSALSDFDVVRDWPELLEACLRILAPQGRLYFSTNSRELAWDSSRVSGLFEDITEESLPPDFRNRRIHRAWRSK